MKLSRDLQSMEEEFTYTCPRCLTKCAISASAVGGSITCSRCSLEFFASPPLQQQELGQSKPAVPKFVLPTKLPFLKSGRRKILEQGFQQLLVANHGTVSDAVENEPGRAAIALGLEKEEAGAIVTDHFTREFERIKRRMESSFLMTDEDVAETESLKQKYNVRLNLHGNASLFRAIYLLEVKHELPPPIATDLMLDTDELCYYMTSTTWHQSRVQNRGYSGTSMSLPTGIRGVRFRFGGYTPVRSEQMTPLSTGTLYVTSKRLLFNGDSRNTTVALRKIVDGHMFSDCLRIEKSTGKPDLFSMDAPHARYVLSLIGVLKGA
jgi:hypothetical protein